MNTDLKMERIRLLEECVKLYDLANEICFCDNDMYPVSAEGQSLRSFNDTCEEDDENQCAEAEVLFDKALLLILERSCFEEVFRLIQRAFRKDWFIACLKKLRSLRVVNNEGFVFKLHDILSEFPVGKVEKQYLITNRLADSYRESESRYQDAVKGGLFDCEDITFKSEEALSKQHNEKGEL